jgi:pimeloyl-ACP methyl ester carboxylesterase
VSPSVYKHDAGRDAITAWCRHAVDHWRTPHEIRLLRTRLGNTSVVVAGGGREAPVIVLPGTNYSAAALLRFADVLVRRRHGQVLLVDLPGQPGLSDEHRAPNPAEYGAWLDEVLFQLDATPRPIVLGHSLGAAIALHADPAHPRLGPLVLVAPAGFVGARLTANLLKATMPWLLRPNRDTAHRLAEFMSSPATEVDAETADWLAAVGRHCRATKAPAPLAGPELARWRDHRLHLVLGADDPFFRPDKVLAAARAAGLATNHVTTVADAGHLVPEERPDAIVDVLRAIDERRG